MLGRGPVRTDRRLKEVETLSFKKKSLLLMIISGKARSETNVD